MAECYHVSAVKDMLVQTLLTSPFHGLGAIRVVQGEGFDHGSNTDVAILWQNSIS